MRFPVIIRYIGTVLIINSVFLFISCIISWYYQETSFFPMLYSALIVLIFGVFPLIYVPSIKYLTLF
jgi:trk system potassium uptake protein